MIQTEFKPGRLEWRTETMTAAYLQEQYLNDPWDDGFLAFSQKEQRLSEGGVAFLNSCLIGKADACGGPEGYLMEAGLWRTRGDQQEELSLERQGDDFFIQYWRLTKDADDASADCYWRTAQTFVRGNLTGLFPGRLASIEVVVPSHRLRLYLTKGVTE